MLLHNGYKLLLGYKNMQQITILIHNSIFLCVTPQHSLRSCHLEATATSALALPPRARFSPSATPVLIPSTSAPLLPPPSAAVLTSERAALQLTVLVSPRQDWVVSPRSPLITRSRVSVPPVRTSRSPSAPRPPTRGEERRPSPTHRSSQRSRDSSQGTLAISIKSLPHRSSASPRSPMRSQKGTSSWGMMQARHKPPRLCLSVRSGESASARRRQTTNSTSTPPPSPPSASAEHQAPHTNGRWAWTYRTAVASVSQAPPHSGRPTVS